MVVVVVVVGRMGGGEGAEKLLQNTPSVALHTAKNYDRVRYGADAHAFLPLDIRIKIIDSVVVFIIRVCVLFLCIMAHNVTVQFE